MAAGSRKGGGLELEAAMQWNAAAYSHPNSGYRN